MSRTDLTVTSADEGPDRKTLTAKFMDIDKREEIRFDFLRNATPWTFVRDSELPP